MREQSPQPNPAFAARTQGYFRWSHPKGTSVGRTPGALPLGAPQGHFRWAQISTLIRTFSDY